MHGPQNYARFKGFNTWISIRTQTQAYVHLWHAWHTYIYVVHCFIDCKTHMYVSEYDEKNALATFRNWPGEKEFTVVTCGIFAESNINQETFILCTRIIAIMKIVRK